MNYKRQPNHITVDETRKKVIISEIPDEIKIQMNIIRNKITSLQSEFHDLYYMLSNLEEVNDE